MNLNNLNLIKKLREKTGAKLIDCQKALAATNGDFKEAEEILKKKCQEIVFKKKEEVVKSGTIGCYLHSNKKLAALVELTCQTDFVAKNSEFEELAHDLAMQVAALDPLYLSPEDIPKEILEKEKETYKDELKKEKKPPKILDMIIEGKLQKFYQQVCLLKQQFIKDPNIKVEDLIKLKIARLGENIKIKRFIRFQI